MSMTPAQLQALLRAAQSGSQLGGQYNSSLGQASPYLGNAASGLGIYGGIQQGGVAGYGSAGANSAKLAGSLSGNKALSSYGGDAGNLLGIYSGLKQGGVGGYGGAAVNAAQLGSNLGAFGGYSGAIGNAAGYAAVPLALYNEVNNWQSGATGSDALAGASSGAAIGTMVLPGLGTAIGALGGAALGALSSAFGSGKVDPENASFEGYTQAYNKALQQGGAGAASQLAASDQNPYTALAGYFDLRSNQLKGQNPIYSTYGRMGEQKFTNDLLSQISNAQKSGVIKPGESATQAYNDVVAPWVGGMGTWQDSNKQAMQGLLQQMTAQDLAGQAGSNWKSVGGDPIFAKSPLLATASPTAAQPQRAVPQQQAIAIPKDIFKAPGMGGATTAMSMARGGQVNDYERAARLHAIYSGGLQKSHFDDGGGVDYFSDPNAGVAPIQDLSGYFDQSNPFSGINQDLGDAGMNTVNATNDPYAYGLGSPSNGSSTSGAASSGLANLLKGLGISGNTASSLAPYAALAPILGSLLGVGQNQGQAPSLPSQYAGQALNMSTPTNTRQQNNLSGMSMNDWLHAAEGPEINYYRNNALPATQMSAPNQQAAQAISAATGQPFAGGYQYAPIPGSGHTTVGGVAPSAPPAPTASPANPGTPNMNIQPLNPQLPVMAAGGPYDSPETAYSSAVGHVQGPGDGTSDSIQLRNAYLSNGEYVIDAPTVSMLGNGSNDSGAKWLDGLRKHVRTSAGKHMVKGKQPMNSSSAASAYAYGGAI